MSEEQLDLDALLERGGGARSDDPDTSHSAVPGRVGPIAAAVLLYLWGAVEAPDEAIIAAVRSDMGCSESSPRKRRGELARSGLVEAVGQTTTQFGKPCLLWALTRRGADFVFDNLDALMRLARRAGAA